MLILTPNNFYTKIPDRVVKFGPSGSNIHSVYWIETTLVIRLYHYMYIKYVVHNSLYTATRYINEDGKYMYW
jgi:hypothetical protein